MTSPRVSTHPFGSPTQLFAPEFTNNSSSRRIISKHSPLLRTSSEAQTLESRPSSSSHFHSLPSPAQSPPSPLRLQSSDRLTDALVQRSEECRFSSGANASASFSPNSTPTKTSKGGLSSTNGHSGVTTPPTTPTEDDEGGDVDMTRSDAASREDTITQYDFSKLDYELERAKVLGTGLWSTVYLAEPTLISHLNNPNNGSSSKSPASPPPTPQKPRPSLLAIKVPSRRDAKATLTHEARILTHLQRHPSAPAYLVPFLGLDPRSASLVFEAIIGGSLENLTTRLKVLTEQSRHSELVSLFPKLADDLISGLDFLHSSGVSVVHADIKSANVLLHVEHHYSLPAPVLRARYIDFSASFVEGKGTAVATAGGGTWEYMAPEQMRILDKELSRPSFASDVWSLGITLLSVVVGGSPYAAVCGENVFMLREAVKTGDPLGFARGDPIASQRMSAAQEFVDCCKLALQKERGRRVTAAGWRAWVRNRHADVWALF